MDVKEILLKVLITSILAGIVGMQRESWGKPAGVRTHILVGLGACLTIMTGYFISFTSPNNEVIDVDVTRISAQVISGIGFLGAWTIIKKGDSVEGLTTGTSLWLSGCIGIAVGSGFYIGSVVTTFASILILQKNPFRGIIFKIKTRGLDLPELVPVKNTDKYYIGTTDRIKTDKEMAKIVYMGRKQYQNILTSLGGETIIKLSNNRKYNHYTGFESLEDCKKAIKELLNKLNNGKL